MIPSGSVCHGSSNSRLDANENDDDLDPKNDDSSSVSADDSSSASSSSSSSGSSCSSSSSRSGSSSSSSYRSRPPLRDETGVEHAVPDRLRAHSPFPTASVRNRSNIEASQPLKTALPVPVVAVASAALLRRRPVPLQGSGSHGSHPDRPSLTPPRYRRRHPRDARRNRADDEPSRGRPASSSSDIRQQPRRRSLRRRRPSIVGPSAWNRRGAAALLSDLCSAMATLLVCTGALVWLSLLALDSSLYYSGTDDGGGRAQLIAPSLPRLRTPNNGHRRQEPGILQTVWSDMQEAWHRRSQTEGMLIPPGPPKFRTTRSNAISNNGDVEALTPECHPADWQLYHFPTCNELHQLDVPVLIEAWKLEQHQQRQSGWGVELSESVNASNRVTRSPIGYVSDGLWRTVWAVPDPGRPSLTVALKLMKLEHASDKRNLDRHRREALVMERLTSHPNIVDVHSHCGTTLLTEYIGTTLHAVLQDSGDRAAHFGGEDRAAHRVARFRDPLLLSTTSSLSFGRITRQTPQGRLHLALQVAKGVQALHALPGGAVAHADLTDQQFLVTPDGRVKLNDFNRCRFVAHRNDTVHTPCPFRIPSAPGIARSPEEYAYEPLTEQIDMYSLANVLHQILSGYGPWDGWSALEVSNQVQKGVKPLVPPEFRAALSDKALQNLTLRAYELDPTRRLRATELVQELERLLAELGE